MQYSDSSQTWNSDKDEQCLGIDSINIEVNVCTSISGTCVGISFSILLKGIFAA